ncbi:MAG: class II aldolase/adducin family protein [Thermocladium sp.]
MNSMEKRRLLVKYFRLSHDVGLNTLMGGNMSVRIKDIILITPSNFSKLELSEDDVVEINMSGEVVQGNRKPSSEWRMHVEIYKRTKYDVVFHAHPPNVLALSNSGIELDKSFSELKSYSRGVGMVPYIEPGTQELANEVAKRIEEGNDLVILEKHGAVAVGSTIEEAFNKMEVLDMVAYVTLNTIKK